jgi:hypothetical protein
MNPDPWQTFLCKYTCRIEGRLITAVWSIPWFGDRELRFGFRRRFRNKPFRLIGKIV